MGNKTNTPEFRAWYCMMRRCNNPKDKRYSRYGGRGITVCAKWNNFDGFLSDMGKRPEGMSLERKNNDGNYTPDNCKWASRKEQANNTSLNNWITFNGITKTVSEWGKVTKIWRGTIGHRINHLGWTPEKALTTPPKVGRPRKHEFFQ